MKHKIRLEHTLQKKGLTETDVILVDEEVRKISQQDAALSDFGELKKTLSLPEGPNYKATLFYQYSLSTSS